MYKLGDALIILNFQNLMLNEQISLASELN